MTIEERMDKIERAFGAQDEMVRELRDAVTVTAQMEAYHSRAMRDHAEWLVAHDRGIQEFREQGRALDRRIPDLGSAIGEFMRRRD
jgi:uncharacterized coiled-coil protein SlyX